MELGNYQLKLFARKPEKGIYGYAQQVVKEICDWFGDKEYKEFGLFMGLAKKLGGGKAELGAGKLKAKFDYVKEKGIWSSHYLVACCRQNKDYLKK